LQQAAGEMGFAVEITETSQVSRLSLPADWEQYLASLDGRDRKELRRKIRNAQTKAGGELIVARSESDVRAACEKIFDFMRDAGGNKGIKANWTYRPMFRRIAGDLVAAGQLQAYLLRLQGRDAAGMISLPSPGGPILWTMGFDRQFASFSPGIVLMGLAIQHAIAAKSTCFDLLRGLPRYKSQLGARDFPIHRITLKRI
jgi:CelD/BcsL family acetyltransferase involved in cellulose biosynthesis